MFSLRLVPASSSQHSVSWVGSVGGHSPVSHSPLQSTVSGQVFVLPLLEEWWALPLEIHAIFCSTSKPFLSGCPRKPCIWKTAQPCAHLLPCKLNITGALRKHHTVASRAANVLALNNRPAYRQTLKWTWLQRWPRLITCPSQLSIAWNFPLDHTLVLVLAHPITLLMFCSL